MSDTPILVIQGARQVGKSTLAQMLMREDSRFVSLDESAARDYAREDPEGFLAQAGDAQMVIDEAQRAPELVLALKAAVDRDRAPGRFVLTGSADLFRAPGSADSLAGRKESVVLRPLSVGEIKQQGPEDFASRLLSGDLSESAPAGAAWEAGTADAAEIAEMVVRGGFPVPLSRSTERARVRWFDSYVEALTTRDARDFVQGDISHRLAELIGWFAARGSTELVKAHLSRHVGVSESTVTSYLDLLRSMYLIDELPAWGRNLGSRVLRRPKMSLVDSGLAAAVSGFGAKHAAYVGSREHFGGLLEQFVAGELLKQQTWSASSYRVFHFRERETEVDVLLELRDGSVIAIEVKSAQSVNRTAAKHILALRDRIGDRLVAGVVLYTGRHSYRMEPWLWALPVSQLWNVH